MVFGRAVFGVSAHRAALFVSIFKAIEHHVVIHHAVADAVATARLGNQIRCIGHRFHATRDDHIIGASDQRIVTIDRGLHRRAAHLRQRHGACRNRNAALDGCLTCRCLTLCRHQAVTENDVVHHIG